MRFCLHPGRAKPPQADATLAPIPMQEEPPSERMLLDTPAISRAPVHPGRVRHGRKQAAPMRSPDGCEAAVGAAILGFLHKEMAFMDCY